jgi:hypothetical protein
MKVTMYSGPSSILALLPKGAALKHIQTRAFERTRIANSLDDLQAATEGTIVSLESTPLPLHPPSIGFYFPNLQFLGSFEIMTIPPQSVWVCASCGIVRQVLKYSLYHSQIQSAQTTSETHVGPTLLSSRSLQRFDIYDMFGSGPLTRSPLIQSSMTTLLNV